MLTTMIDVTRHHGTEQVRATLSKSSLLGVHRTLAGMWKTVEKWQITHVPTGYCVLGFYFKPDALRIMRYIDCWDWGFTDPKSPPDETRRRARDLLSILRNDTLLKDITC